MLGELKFELLGIGQGGLLKLAKAFHGNINKIMEWREGNGNASKIRYDMVSCDRPVEY
jgi:hypothetical protein